MIYSLFMSPDHAAFTDDVDDEQFSKSSAVITDQSQFNVLFKKVEQFIVSGSFAPKIPNAALSDWQIAVAKITGGATKCTIVGKDTDGTTTITNVLTGYGTDLFPGFIMFSTYNVTTITFSAIDSGVKVEFFLGIAAADDDTRLITNA